MCNFAHLHNHTEFSLLDGAAKIKKMIKKAADNNMPAVAITDHGNMFGVPKFVLTAREHKIKPIVGCELYIARDHTLKKREEAEEGGEKKKLKTNFHQILWAKNDKGYQNLIKLCSIGFTEGFYYKPRIDRKLLREHAEGLIGSTCCLGSEINQALLSQGEEAAETMLRDYIDIFAPGDYYVEIQRHGLGDQEKANEWLLRMAKKYNLKVIASNDVHYVNREDSEAHDLLLALQTGADINDPKRFRFTNDDERTLNSNFYFKAPDEMQKLFADIPQALENTLEIVDKCDFEMNLAGKMLMPQYKVPPQFKDMDDYLKHMVYERAPKRYGELSQDIVDRIELELAVMKKQGYAGYFLIVQSFTTVARERGVYVGPGRGSAAGSVVAYILGIIDIDPLAYDLLFERFLNPERISPPDIDIDFDDEGRQAVIDYVVEEYGRKSVSQVITYGTMGAKTALRDVGRTLGLPLAEVNRIAKMIPERPGMTFEKAMSFEDNPDFAEELKRTINSPDPTIQKLMRFSQTLEGTARHTGIHACAVIIAPGDVTNYAPISTSKEGDYVTQYDGPNAEKCGLLKMDFLGLKTLSILKTASEFVQKTRGVTVNPNIPADIPLDDLKTYELYQRGETIGTFQFESDGMQKYLRQLKPTNIEDLIAMNALYRPGPMDNIPSFIARKHGREEVTYPHPLLEPILKNTYGIMVYQEQIMQAAQRMANYSLGGADLLRRAMGKKKLDEMAKERAKFVTGAAENQIPEKLAGEVFDTMEKFASYGFNKSHAAAYSVLAFKTAYFKAHFPSEYMASVLAHNLNDIKKITFFIEECRRMGIAVLPPNINESEANFSVKKDGTIRFGLEAIKGVGGAVVQAIIEDRTKNGPFVSIFDLCKRLPPRTASRKVLESLTYAGAFDGWKISRFRYFLTTGVKDEQTALDKALSYGSKFQSEASSSQHSLFGGGGGSSSAVLAEPEIPTGTMQNGEIAEEWSRLEELNHEKEVIGFYLSGHPLDRYKWQLNQVCNAGLGDLEDIRENPTRENREKAANLKVAGIVTSVRDRIAKSGNKFLTFVLEDFTGSVEIALFSDQYAQYRSIVEANNMLMINGLFQPKKFDPSEWELRVQSIQLLSDEGIDKMFKYVSLNIDYALLDDALLDNMIATVDKFPGKFPLRFRVRDEQMPAEINLTSAVAKVHPSAEFVQAMRGMGVEVVAG